MWKYCILSLLAATIIGPRNVCADQQEDEKREADSDAGNILKEAGLELKSEPDLQEIKLDQDLAAESANLADFLLERGLPRMSEPSENEKRGRRFGFVGSRGRRREMSEGSFMTGQEPLGSGKSLSARLRRILEGSGQEMLPKDKRRPHFGFHGARG